MKSAFPRVENKNCRTCKYDEDRYSDICYYDCIQFSNYELKQYTPKEKPMENKVIFADCTPEEEESVSKMIKSKSTIISKNVMKNKVIFESEEEFDKFYDDIEHLFDAEKDTVRDIFNDKGYIRKSVVEEMNWHKLPELPQKPDNVAGIIVLVYFKYGNPKIIYYGDFGYSEDVFYEAGLAIDVEKITHWAYITEPEN